MYIRETGFHLSIETDQEVVAKLAELDMMVADLERANSRVVTVERRNVCSIETTVRFDTEQKHLGATPCGD